MSGVRFPSLRGQSTPSKTRPFFTGFRVRGKEKKPEEEKEEEEEVCFVSS